MAVNPFGMSHCKWKGILTNSSVLGAFVVRLRDQPESNWGDIILQSTKVAPTIWPIVFAAVVGGMLKASAHHKVQQGASLGVSVHPIPPLDNRLIFDKSIEQMMESQTVFSTLRSAFSLRLFGFSTLILLILWSLNPIGGQASLRMLSLGTPANTQSTSITYMSLDPQIALRFDVFGGTSSVTYYRPLIASLFGSALYSPEAAAQYLVGSEQDNNFTDVISQLGGMHTAILRSEQDSWGNVRIPVLHLLPGFDPGAPDAWVHVPEDEIPSFSSIIGVPIHNFPTGYGTGSFGNITFNIESNYHRFKVYPVPFILQEVAGNKA